MFEIVTVYDIVDIVLAFSSRFIIDKMKMEKYIVKGIISKS